MSMLKLVIVASIAATGIAASTPFMCSSDTWGACCQAYDPGDQVCIRGSFATNTSGSGPTTTYQCDTDGFIFEECCLYPRPNPSANPYTNCTPSKNA